MAGQRFVTRSIITAMSRTLTASVSPSAMAHNLARIRRQVQENRSEDHMQADTRLWAVVKADAYGHGLANALTGFAEADGMALLDLDVPYSRLLASDPSGEQGFETEGLIEMAQPAVDAVLKPGFPFALGSSFLMPRG